MVSETFYDCTSMRIEYFHLEIYFTDFSSANSSRTDLKLSKTICKTICCFRCGTSTDPTLKYHGENCEAKIPLNCRNSASLHLYILQEDLAGRS